MSEALTRQRLDKWLWAARWYKTRALAAEEAGKGRIEVNGLPAKPGRELKAGDLLHLRQSGGVQRELRVLGLSAMRGPAPQARLLYEETPQSIERQARAQALHRMGVEPALERGAGRPTKRDRRELADWERWSASTPAREDDPDG
jgi:ribosome-associated heat shock protein Hsp15